ncbi:MAG TPA: hypothetical protein VHZ54_00970 [Solirubrobacterales bacterium]|jgi:hypothetical protein|nr:hypothetical protein [Solirubrobacterales bacterium]
MRIASCNRGRLRTVVVVAAVAVAAFCSLAGVAQAASPGWKLLAATGPTNVPPTQSEVQRVIVEAEGGSFEASSKVTGQGDPVVTEGHLTYTAGSPVATIESVAPGASFEVGARITPPGVYFEQEETTVEACSSDCSAPGSTITLSAPAAASETDAPVEIFTKRLVNVIGGYRVGDEVVGKFVAFPFTAPYFPPGTVVTAVGPGTLTLSNPTSYLFVSEEVAVGLESTQQTGPIAFNASPQAFQEALAGLTEFAEPGAVTVSGGPGGDAGHPYSVAFGGSLTDKDVNPLPLSGAALTGAHAALHVSTTVPGGPGTGEIGVDPVNVGALPTIGEYTVTVGPLPAGIVTSGPAAGDEWNCPGGAGESIVTCTSANSVPGLDPANGLRIPFELEPSAPSAATVPMTISGGGAGPASYTMPITISNQPASAGAQAFWAGAFNASGEPETQAGAHPYSAQSYFLLNTLRSPNGYINPVGDSKDVIVDLSPGFIGNPLVTPRCPQSKLTGAQTAASPACNEEMAVGNFLPILSEFAESASTFAFPIFNDTPPPGAAAEFTTRVAFPLQSLLASVRSSGDYGIRITAPNNPNFQKIFGSYAALGGELPGAHGKAFLTNATDCANEAIHPPVVASNFHTWQEPAVFSGASETLPPVIGCDQLEFHPSFSFQPTDTQGSSPVGATASLHVPQDGLTDAAKLTTPDLKKAVVTLPQGLTLNPSSANGLQACSEAQIGYMGDEFAEPNPTRFDESAPACPDASKLGTAEIKTPLLENPLMGTIYLAAQKENPFGSLVAIYLVVDDAQSGVILKLPGEVRLDPSTGQLTATFDHNPQLPFDDLTLHFRGGGPRAALATPEICGHYATTGTLTPWSAPESGPPAQIEEVGFDVTNGCSSSASARPFSPSFEAGTAGTQAGGYSPLVVKVGRKDGEQELTSLDFTLPKGLIGKLAGIPYCSDAQIAEAEHKTGKQEQSSSSCPAASQIGTVDTSAGVGSEPFHVGGKLYLAGPYKGAPVSSVVVTPAVAGPFDLGDVVVRAPLYVNPETAVLTAKSDPIPTILEGIPLKVRSVEVNVDRPGFILNPTNCTPMTATASIGSGDGARANSSNRFQVGGCENLKFAPKLQVKLKGGTRRNGNPALTAILTQAPGQANISFASVALPHSEFLEQGHIRTVCTRVQFAAEQCPAAAIYGHAEAVTPLLDQPLTGPVYLRSSSHRLPDLVAALKGPPSQPIEVDLDGRIDSLKGGIRTTFEAVPDAPVSKFVLRMQGGKKGLLVNSTNVCKGKHEATAKLTGQNGLQHNFLTPVKPQCGKKKSNKPKKSGKK